MGPNHSVQAAVDTSGNRGKCSARKVRRLCLMIVVLSIGKQFGKQFQIVVIVVLR